MNDVSQLEIQDDGILRFYRVYARRPSDFAVLEEEFNCREHGGENAEHMAKRAGAKLIGQGFTQVKIDLVIVHPIARVGIDG